MNVEKCYVVINKQTGVIIKTFLNRDCAKLFVEQHNETCFSYEQLYAIVESEFVGGDCT